MRTWRTAVSVAAVVALLMTATVSCSKKNEAADDAATTTSSVGTNDTAISPNDTAGGGGGDTSTSTTDGPTPSSTPGPGPTPTCPDIALPVGVADLTVGTGDYRGGGGDDTLYVYNVGGGTWVLLVQFSGGGAAQTTVSGPELFAGGAAALNGGDIDQDGQDEVFAREGAGAYAALIGVHEIVGCSLVPVTLDALPAKFAVGASIGSIGGAQCGRSDDGVAYSFYIAEGSSLDGQTFDVVTHEHSLNGTVLNEIPPPFESTASYGDEGYVAASTFGCYTVSYVP